MTTKTRKCLAVFSIGAAIAIYAAGAYRIEMARQTPHFAVMCSQQGHCAPHNVTFAAVGMK